VRDGVTQKLTALDPRTGARAWQVDSERTSYAQIAGATVVVTNTQTRRIVALDYETGARLWERQTHGSRVWPTVQGDSLHVQQEEQAIVSLDLRTGREQWRCRVDAPILGFQRQGPRMIVATRDAVRSVDADGRTVWTWRPPHPIASFWISVAD
jgi:outer membrane protein assembly factor BamB